MASVLDGIRVVDLTMWAFVPAAGGVLSQWGADVIKVENPGSPDPSRLLGGTLQPGGASRSFKNYNRGKRAIALDLSSAEGRDVLYRLIDTADVFLTSFLPSTRRKLGIDIDQVRARNPNIVYAKGTGLGPLGAESERRGYDAAIWWARGSLAHSAMEVSGAQTPTGMVGHGDAMSGIVLAGGICAGLLQRALTGVAPVVDGSLLATAVWFNHQPIIASSPGLRSPVTVSRTSAESPASMRNYLTKDKRFITLMFVNLATDPRFATTASRAANQAESVRILTEIFGAMTLDEVKQTLRTARGAWAPVQTPREMHEDPQVLANRYLQGVDYPEGTLNIPSPPLLFDLDAGTLKRAPDFGEHTDEILRELGFGDDDIGNYRREGIVA
jgi:crotonobetainyl-CoA:carnitine CoA-transferase CaiB-like acyl-CoA transferase